jgi:hypothetical protein
MLEKIKRSVFAAQTRITVCAGLGIFFIANSFMRSGLYSGHSVVSGASFKPIPLAIGVMFLLVAWLIYKKWSTNLKK